MLERIELHTNSPNALLSDRSSDAVLRNVGIVAVVAPGRLGPCS